MALSKVKSNKQRLRLKARQNDWERIPLSDKIGKLGKPSFTKPGSNKK
jgi:hypothetical protein